jgi:hypothetical protein
MIVMSKAGLRSYLTFARRRARLLVDYAATGRSHEPYDWRSDDVPVRFACLSAVLTDEAAARTHDVDRVVEALDEDLALAPSQIEGSPMLMRFIADRRTRAALVSHVPDVLALTERETAGPYPRVDVHLLLPGSDVPETTVDADIALVFRTSAGGADSLSELTRAMTPMTRVPTAPVVLQARRNAQARSALLEEFGALTSAQVAELAGSGAKNASALASRWRREGRLVAVEHHGTLYFPAFQFDDDGKPKPAVAEVLEQLGTADLSAWQQALWFTTANGWLDGRRPVDVLDESSGAVVAAASEAVREPVG